MAEYIDRADALDAASSFIRAESIRYALERLPVADVVSRKDYDELQKDNDICNAAMTAMYKPNGKWKHKQLDKFRKYEVVCSVCGAKYIGNYDAYDEPYDFNYCPNCGARMVDE